MKIYVARFNAVLNWKKPSHGFLSEQAAEDFCEAENIKLMNEYNEYLEEIGEELMDYDEYVGDNFEDAWEVEEIEVEEEGETK